MRKAIFLFVSVIIISGYLQAQDMLLTWEGDTLGNSVTVWGEPSAEEIIFQAIVHNNTEAWMKVKVRRTQIEMIDSTSSYFCWGDCFDIDIDESPDSLLIPSGGSSVDSAFTGRYIPNMKNGTSIVEYMFYNMENESQNVKVLVEYWASPNSVGEDNINAGRISDLYPNPGSTSVTLDYNLSAQVNSASVFIANIFGNTVERQDIDPAASKLTMDISSLESGVYFFTILIDGSLYKTQKLIIQ